jgi:hypothetical protein
MFLKYLLYTTVAGGAAGAAHGIASVHCFHKQEPLEKALYVAVHAQTGAVVGPWTPVLIPIWLTLDGGNQNTRCPAMKGGVYHRKRAMESITSALSCTPTDATGQKPNDHPTVAEKP